MAPLILDGGFSRELIRLGAPFRQPQWSATALIEAPEYVSQVHNLFIEAGADIITTNSYALVPYHIGMEKFQQEGSRLAALAARLAREAANQASEDGKKILVAGSLPPVFGSYEPENFSPSKVHDYLSLLVQAMDPYVDFWLAETLSLIEEAKAATEVLSEVSGEKPVWVSFTLGDSDSLLRGGETLEQAATWALGANIEALLLNCSPPEQMAAGLREITEVFAKHGGTAPKVGIYANAFVPLKDRSGSANTVISKIRDDMTRDKYIEFAGEWKSLGADIVGGCCGIGADHIKVLVEKLQ